MLLQNTAVFIFLLLGAVQGTRPNFYSQKLRLSCAGPADCDSDEKCVSGECIECEADVDCDSDEFCVDGECDDCKVDGDCDQSDPDEPEFCVDGYCDTCRSDADCTEVGNFCDDGDCALRCSSDADCDTADGECCSIRETCETNDCDCDSDEFCGTDGICYDVDDKCSSDAECDTDEACGGGICVNKCTDTPSCDDYYEYCKDGLCTDNDQCAAASIFNNIRKSKSQRSKEDSAKKEKRKRKNAKKKRRRRKNKKIMKVLTASFM